MGHGSGRVIESQYNSILGCNRAPAASRGLTRPCGRPWLGTRTAPGPNVIQLEPWGNQVFEDPREQGRRTGLVRPEDRAGATTTRPDHSKAALPGSPKFVGCKDQGSFPNFARFVEHTGVERRRGFGKRDFGLGLARRVRRLPWRDQARTSNALGTGFSFVIDSFSFFDPSSKSENSLNPDPRAMLVQDDWLTRTRFGLGRAMALGAS